MDDKGSSWNHRWTIFHQCFVFVCHLELLFLCVHHRALSDCILKNTYLRSQQNYTAYLLEQPSCWERTYAALKYSYVGSALGAVTERMSPASQGKWTQLSWCQQTPAHMDAELGNMARWGRRQENMTSGRDTQDAFAKCLALITLINAIIVAMWHHLHLTGFNL